MRVSRLGFGAMRLPMVEVEGKQIVDEDKALPTIRRAFELGVNYVDTAWMYGNHTSENAVGKAVTAWGRDKVYVSSKYPFNGSLRETLEKQLSKLGLDYLDVYHLHGIGASFLRDDKRDGIVSEAMRAKDEGLIRNFSFSFHDGPRALIELVDSGLFASVLCQYNLLDRSNEDGLAHAKSKGLGTVVMGPLGGGRLAGMSTEAASKFGIEVKSNVELALRFVLANPSIDICLSGMGSIAMVEENAAVASNESALTEEERRGVKDALQELKELAKLYCTACEYCTPYCAQGVAIPRIFGFMNDYRIYGLKEHAKGSYAAIGKHDWSKGANAEACVQCGLCEEHCPQKIEIRKQLKECHAALSG